MKWDSPETIPRLTPEEAFRFEAAYERALAFVRRRDVEGLVGEMQREPIVAIALSLAVVRIPASVPEGAQDALGLIARGLERYDPRPLPPGVSPNVRPRQSSQGPVEPPGREAVRRQIDAPPPRLTRLAVCAAHGVPFDPFNHFSIGMDVWVLVLPHPSGRCRLWNSVEGAVEKAHDAVREFTRNEGCE